MSGIVGIVNLDGRPVDPELLERMTASLDFRGPDAHEVWTDGAVGFGHTLLRTTYEAEHERQPFSFDGQTFIVADCRVDAREELVGKLRAKGRAAAALDRPDVELILHAWHVWGEACVEHLLGDFAFAIWDAPNRRLFCARDHMGVKLFYYAQKGATVVFSNTLDCVRLHPAVSDRLNDLAIADFLLFDLNQDPATTVYADVGRLPAAHTARWEPTGFTKDRYWTLPIEEPVYFKRSSDYTDRFIELLDQAVADRLRTDKVGVFMSGGLDSTTLAATACKLQRARSPDAEVHAFATIMDELDGGERYFAQLAADHLGIPLHIQDLSGVFGDPNWQNAVEATPEPFINPTRLRPDRVENRRCAKLARVWFYGEGPDNALKYEWSTQIRYLAKRRRFGRLTADIAEHIRTHRRLPLISSLPAMVRGRWLAPTRELDFPPWFNEALSERLALKQRAATFAPNPISINHPTRPQAHGSFELRNWDALFQILDPEFMKAEFEVRHPFLALPVLTYMLSVPAMPWCRKKMLLRRAMKGHLPDQVLTRPKSPLQGSPAERACEKNGLPPLVPHPDLCKYATLTLAPSGMKSENPRFNQDFRPIALNYWLTQLRPATSS